MNYFIIGLMGLAAAWILAVILIRPGRQRSDRPDMEAEDHSVAPPEVLNIQEQVISKPIRGKVVALEAVPDPAFSRKVVGEGVAIIPDEGRVYAPFDGVVESLMQSGHALCLKSMDGVELLIHVGLDTMGLKGEGFLPRIREGERFEAGRLLMEFDLDYIKGQGYNLITPVVITH